MKSAPFTAIRLSLKRAEARASLESAESEVRSIVMDLYREVVNEELQRRIGLDAPLSEVLEGKSGTVHVSFGAGIKGLESLRVAQYQCQLLQELWKDQITVGIDTSGAERFSISLTLSLARKK